jgi:MFS family permease
LIQRGGQGLGHSLGVLRHRDFTLFYGALVVAAIGGALQTFANILLIYDLTHSPFHIGLTGLARAIPLMTLSLVGGVIADRVDRRVLIMFAQGTAAGLALLLATLTATGSIQEGQVMEAIGRLPEKYRSIIVMRHFKHMDVNEIAIELNKPEGTIKSWLFRARAILKKDLQVALGA